MLYVAYFGGYHSPSGTKLAVLCLHSRDYHQASVAGAGIDDPDDPVLKRRIANGEFLNTPSPPSCKVFIANVSNLGIFIAGVCCIGDPLPFAIYCYGEIAYHYEIYLHCTVNCHS